MTKKRRRDPVLAAALVAAVTVGALILGGCGAGGGDSTVAGGKVKAGGTLHVLIAEEPLNLDPASEEVNAGDEWVLGQIAEPLFMTRPDGRVVPWLVKSVQSSADKRNWHLQLRPGVRFSTGKPLTAVDVVFSINQIRHNPVFGFMFEPIVDVQADGKMGVTIQTRTPMPALPSSLSLQQADIVPDDLGGATPKEFGRHPIGTGPFALESTWDPGKPITLVKNPYYRRSGEPKVSKLVLETVAESSSRSTQLKAGQADVIQAPAFSEVPQLEGSPGLKVADFVEGSLDVLLLNSRSPVFKDPKVAEAIDLAIDREALVKAAQSGVGKPAGTWFPPTVLYNDATLLSPPDPGRAKTLLEEAVKEDGVVPSFTFTIPVGDAVRSTMAQAIQQELDEVGFKVTLQPLDPAALQTQLAAGKLEATYGYMESSISDPSLLTAFFVGSEGFYTQSPIVKTVEQMTDTANNTNVSPGDRDALYKKIQQDVVRAGALVPLVSRPFVYAMKSNVDGLEVGVGGTPLFARAGYVE